MVEVAASTIFTDAAPLGGSHAVSQLSTTAVRHNEARGATQSRIANTTIVVIESH
jgi:hypothetical protein